MQKRLEKHWELTAADQSKIIITIQQGEEIGGGEEGLEGFMISVSGLSDPCLDDPADTGMLYIAEATKNPALQPMIRLFKSEAQRVISKAIRDKGLLSQITNVVGKPLGRLEFNLEDASQDSISEGIFFKRSLQWKAWKRTAFFAQVTKDIQEIIPALQRNIDEHKHLQPDPSNLDHREKANQRVEIAQERALKTYRQTRDEPWRLN